MSTKYNHNDYGTTGLRNYGATQVRNHVHGSKMTRTWVRFAAMVMMMLVVEVKTIWGQNTDYSGTYYIASNYIASKANKYDAVTLTNNYYLCPTEGWAFYVSGGTVTSTDNGQPFITTHKRANGDEAKYKWIIEKHIVEGVDYYTFKYSIDYVDGESTHHTRYMSYSRKLSGAGVDRMRVHLEKTENPGDNELFRIVVEGAYLVISPKNTDADENDATHKTKYLTVNGGNKDSYKGESGKVNGPSGYTNTAGVIGTYYDITDVNVPLYLEDVITRPAIAYNSSNLIEISDQTGNATAIYYTTDGSTPTTSSTLYAGAFAPTDNVTTIKAVVIVDNEVSNVATFKIDSHQYLIQSVECMNFYMMPGDVSNGNTTVNTSSLFRSTMAWTFTYAGYEGGIQYYYIKNGTSYLFRTSTNIYIKTNSDFEGATDKTGYMFSIGHWFDKVSMSFLEGYNIIPKGATFNTCIFKDGYAAGVLANEKNNVVKNGEKTPESYTRWNIIPYAAPGNVLPTSLVTSDESNPTLFKIENLGTPGQYMNDASTVGTATTGSNELAWYIKEAAFDSERKYYYIIHKTTGKYLKFNKTIASPPSSMQGQNNVLSLDYDGSASDRYQFVFAKSTVDGAYYIVPKGLEEASNSQYYALYLDASDTNQPIKSTKNRQSDSYKWKLVPFCYNPVFAESERSITLSCATTGAEIHYTEDGNDPTSSSTLYDNSSWTSSDQHAIKAIAVIKDGSEIVSTSEVVTLLNKPTVTLESGPFVYEGRQLRPEVKSVKVGTTEAPTSPATYTKEYHNNINVGTASVDIADADENDNWYIWNVPTTNFTINKITLTVRADNKTVEYGSAPPTNYSISYSGWAIGDIARLEGIDTKPTATCTGYTTTSAVGSTHQIIPSGGVDNNYDFEYVNGTLTVAAAFVTLTANSGTVTYNGAEQTVTGYTCSVDGLSFTDAGVSASGSGTDVGTYDVTFSGVTLNSTKDNTNQYVVTNIVEGTLTINPAEATVTADNKTKTYGETDPTLTATVSGLYGSDAIAYTLNRATGNNVGDYVITPTGDAAQGNYTVSYVPGTFTINQKALTITANNHVITYGIPPENNGVTYSGFIEGENENTEGVFTGTLAYKYNSANDESGDYYTTTIPKGTFYIIPSGLTAKNYAITYAYGTLTVNAKSIGDGSIASGFTLSFGDGGAIVLKDGETDLYLTTDYTIGSETTSSSGRYSEKTVSGTGNYTGYFSIRNAIVNFQTDDQEEWSATFIAEPAGDYAVDNTKGHKLPDGVRAYIITSIEGNWAIPEALNYIPEGIPVLLVSDKASGGFLVEDASDHTPITTTGDGNQKDANMLEVVKEGMIGYVTDTESPNYKKAHFNLKTIYLLSYNEFVFNMDGYLSDGKVFLNPIHPSDPSSASPSHAPMRLGINWDIVNGIKEIPDKGKDEKRNSGQWYGLDGRQLNGIPTRKGLYFHDGKKVIIKEDL